MSETAKQVMADEGMGQRRRPRWPARVSLLLWTWLALVVGGLVLLWVVLTTYPKPMERWDLKAPVVVMLVASWGLLFWRTKVLIRMDEKVKRAGKMVCLNCCEVLEGGERGRCGRCGVEYTGAHVRDVWGKHMP